jgi:hypothetical protein
LHGEIRTLGPSRGLGLSSLRRFPRPRMLPAECCKGAAMTLASQLVALAALWVSKLSLDAIRAHPRWSGAPWRASSSASGASPGPADAAGAVITASPRRAAGFSLSTPELRQRDTDTGHRNACPTPAVCIVSAVAPGGMGRRGRQRGTALGCRRRDYQSARVERPRSLLRSDADQRRRHDDREGHLTDGR